MRTFSERHPGLGNRLILGMTLAGAILGGGVGLVAGAGLSGVLLRS
jgi:hypothetical protein